MNNTQINYEKNRNYFFISYSIEIFIASICSFIILILVITKSSHLGIIFLCLSICIVVSVIMKVKAGNCSNENDIDKSYQNANFNILNKALNKFGLDSEQIEVTAPIVFSGMYLGKINDNICYYKIGEDNIKRTTHYRKGLILFSKEQIYIYEYLFSIIYDEQVERTQEYFYTDIVSVSNSFENGMEEFTITTSGGTNFSIALSDIRTDDSKAAIQSAKQLIRERKSALK